MPGTTKIEWATDTWNPVTGCDRISPGCDNCYALDMAARLKAMGSIGYQNDGDPRTSGPGFALTEHPDRLDQPMRWKKPRRIFVNSMSDLFHIDVSDQFIEKVFDVMHDAPQHVFQVLTKRTQRMAKWSWQYYDCDHGGHPTFSCPHCAAFPNVWLGTSIEKDLYTFRANRLRETKAAVRFLSLEPLLGPLPSLDLTDIDWVIVGGESGKGARPMHPDWVRDIRDRCVKAAVPFFFKQWGEWAPMYVGAYGNRQAGYFGYNGEWSSPTAKIWGTEHPPQWTVRMGKHRSGRVLDGKTWDDYPTQKEH